jgi:hypothetical protein
MRGPISPYREGQHRILPVNHTATIIWHTARMPEHYDLTLLDPDGKPGRDIAMLRIEMEELHAKLARMPAVIAARAALGIIFMHRRRHDVSELVASGALMEPWAAVVSAVAVGLVAGLLAGTEKVG